MWLEDNDYLVNEETRKNLNTKAKQNKVKLIATDKAKKKTPKERSGKILNLKKNTLLVLSPSF